MSALGVEVLFVLPKPVPSPQAAFVRILSPEDVTGDPAGRARALKELARVSFLGVDVELRPYASPAAAVEERAALASRVATGLLTKGRLARTAAAAALVGSSARGLLTEGPGVDYGGDLMAKVRAYAELATRLALEYDFDVVHAHDWMTYLAGMASAEVSGKPLVVHVHSTEFDRSGEHVNQPVYDIERAGMHAADRVITVSFLTRALVMARYAVAPDKIDVVYNAINHDTDDDPPIPSIERDEKIVLFLGRITMQKGPDYFVRAAKRVLEVMDNVRFIMAGSGDMARASIELAADLGIGHKVLFTGFLRGPDVERVFRMADLYVMPSVSEPFGIAPLEAIRHDVPVIISRQSGVSEILTHALKVDFWDVDELANKIIAVLRHPPLHATLRQHSRFEVRRLRWEDSAARCVEAYGKAINARAT
jgi:glycosyltransferase involved in cell wall biosynthesis